MKYLIEKERSWHPRLFIFWRDESARHLFQGWSLSFSLGKCPFRKRKFFQIHSSGFALIFWVVLCYLERELTGPKGHSQSATLTLIVSFCVRGNPGWQWHEVTRFDCEERRSHTRCLLWRWGCLCQENWDARIVGAPSFILGNMHFSFYVIVCDHMK